MYMARPLRIEYPGAVYHITSRGNAGHNIYQDDQDRKTFLKVLTEVIRNCNWYCHAYCLMRTIITFLLKLRKLTSHMA